MKAALNMSFTKEHIIQHIEYNNNISIHISNGWSDPRVREYQMAKFNSVVYSDTVEKVYKIFQIYIHVSCIGNYPETL